MKTRVDAGKLKPVVTVTVSLAAGVATAQNESRSGRAKGKIILKFAR